MSDVVDLDAVRSFVHLLMVDREEMQTNPLGRPLEIAVNYAGTMEPELRALRREVAALKDAKCPIADECAGLHENAVKLHRENARLKSEVAALKGENEAAKPYVERYAKWQRTPSAHDCPACLMLAGEEELGAKT